MAGDRSDIPAPVRSQARALVLAVLLAPLLHCTLEPDYAADLPPASGCDPGAPGGVDPVTGVSFDPSAMLCVGLQMDDAEFAELQRQGRLGGDSELEIIGNVVTHLVLDCTTPYPGHFTWFEADAQVGGASASRVGVRKKGFLGSVIGTGLVKPSLKIKTDRFVPGQTLGGTERVTLNNSSQDISRMVTCLTYDVFHAAGYPAPLCNLANVMVNDRPMGAYVHVEAIKKRFLGRAFGNDDGSLYEGTVGDFTPDFVSAFSPGNLGRFDAKTGDTDVTGAPLRRVVDALSAADDQLLVSLESVLDLERFFTFWALEVLVKHDDGYTSNRNNFYVYFDPDDGGRAVFIPWGPDHAFTDEDLFEDGDTAVGLDFFVRSELTRRLSRIPEARARFDAEARRVLDEVWKEDAVLASIDVYADQVRSAERGEDFDEELARLRGWVRARRAQLTGRLDAGLPEGDATAMPCADREIVQVLLDLAGKIGFIW